MNVLSLFFPDGFPRALVFFVGTGLIIVIGIVVAVILVRRSKHRSPVAPLPQPAPTPVQDPRLAAAALAPTFAISSLPSEGSRPPAPSVAELAPDFPGLEILDLIGRGGQGLVYRVRSLVDDQVFALKIVAGDGAQGEAFAARFMREAEALGRLAHPNIVAIRAHGRNGRWCWLLMDFIDGANLREVQSTGALSPAQALALVPPLCAALQYAHDQGVVHRDLKPANILLDQHGRPHLVDFGLAKLTHGASGETLTASGATMGTVHYMAPEQVEGAGDVDHRADIYALGVVLYELLTGRLPLGRFERPSQRVEVDVRIDEVVLRALERDPNRRWQQAGELSGAVEGIRGTGRQSGAAAGAGRAAGLAPAEQPGAARPWGMSVETFTCCMHLAQFLGLLPFLPFLGFALPIVMWLTCRKQDARIDAHGRLVMNWIFSEFIYGFICLFLCLIIIGIPLVIVLGCCGLIFPIIGAVNAADNVLWPYPYSLRLLRVPDPEAEAKAKLKPAAHAWMDQIGRPR